MTGLGDIGGVQRVLRPLRAGLASLRRGGLGALAQPHPGAGLGRGMTAVSTGSTRAHCEAAGDLTFRGAVLS